MQGALVRSCFCNLEQMDVPLKLFCSLERKNIQKQFIHSLHTVGSALLTNSAEFRNAVADFYRKLHKRELGPNWVGDDAFFGGLPQVPAESLVELDARLTMKELKRDLQEMSAARPWTGWNSR